MGRTPGTPWTLHRYPVRTRLVLADFTAARRHIIFTPDIEAELLETAAVDTLWISSSHPDCSSRVWETSLVPRSQSFRCGSSCVALVRSGHFGAWFWRSWAIPRFHRHLDTPARASRPGRIVALFRFIPVVERWIEARHAQMHHNIVRARHAGLVHLGFHSALPMIRARLEQDPSFITNLANHLDKVSNAAMMVLQFGLWFHPTIQAALKSAEGKYDL